MESRDVNSSSPEDARFEAVLRTNLALDALPDDGFSRKVTAAIVVPRPVASLRYWMCLAGLAAGVGVAAVALPAPQDWQLTLPAMEGDAAESFRQLASAPVLGAALLTACSLVYAFGLRWSRLTSFLRR